jgi:hypothetical protein
VSFSSEREDIKGNGVKEVQCTLEEGLGKNIFIIKTTETENRG